MRRQPVNLVFLVLLVLILPVAAAHAQADSRRYTWSPYDFTLNLPDDWTASSSDECLILGLPADVAEAAAGNVPTGIVVEVWIVEASDIDYDYAPPEQDVWEMRTFGTHSYSALNLPPTSERQGWLVVIERTYLLVVSAPAESDFPPTVTDLIASIEATPAIRTASARLTNTIAWHDLALTVPGDWEIMNFGARLNMVLFNSYYNHLKFVQTFKLENLVIILTDYSQYAQLYTPEDLFSLEGYLYQPQDYEFGPIISSSAPGYVADAADFTDPAGNTAGRAVVIRAPGKLYQMIGLSGPDQWQATEQQLFEAILATLEVSP